MEYAVGCFISVRFFLAFFFSFLFCSFFFHNFALDIILGLVEFIWFISVYRIWMHLRGIATEHYAWQTRRN